MSKREKIILLLTLGIVIYGLLDFWVLSREKGGPDLVEKSRTAQDFSARAMAKISKIELQDNKRNWQAWTSRIESDWDQDPFVRYSEPKTQKNKGISSGAGLIFSGYMLAGNKAFAIINGMEYKIGEIIDPQGFLVKKITPAKVILQRKSEHIVLYLKEE